MQKVTPFLDGRLKMGLGTEEFVMSANSDEAYYTGRFLKVDRAIVASDVNASMSSKCSMKWMILEQRIKGIPCEKTQTVT